MSISRRRDPQCPVNVDTGRPLRANSGCFKIATGGAGLEIKAVEESNLSVQIAALRKALGSPFSIASVFSHCPKCMIRAGLWDPEKWPDTTNLPSFAETLIAHAKLTEPLEAVAAMIETCK